MKWWYFFLPLVIAIELYFLSFVFQFLSAASDFFVFVGLLLICVFVAANYYLVKYLTKPNEKKPSNPSTSDNNS